MPAGRPTDYRPDFPKQALRLAKLGATDADLAEFFEVNVLTIYRWKLAHEEFCNALKLGKEDADEAVQKSLYKRAMGYTHDAVKIMQYEGRPVEVPYLEHHAPDTTACIFWLKNRRPDLWRDVNRQEHTGADGGPIEFKADAPAKETREEWLDRQRRVGTATGTAIGGNPSDVVR